MSALLVKSHVRFAWRHPVAPVASLVGVTLAVMAVVAVHLVGTSLRASLEAATDASLGGYTHVVTRANLAETDYFALRRRWRSGELPTVQAVIPVIDDYVRVAGAPLRLVGFDPLAGRGVSAAAASAGAEYAEFLTDDVLFANAETAAAIAATGTVAELPVRVIEASDNGILLADLPTAQRLLGRAGELDAVWIRVASVRSAWLEILDALLPGVEAALPAYADPAIDGYQVTARRRWNPLSRFTDASIFNLGVLALLSLLMAAFLVVQVSYANAARRRVEHERLLALGASPQRLQVLAAAEGCTVGSLGAALGMALGMAVAHALLQAAQAGAAALRLPPMDAWVVGKALFCGVVVAALGRSSPSARSIEGGVGALPCRRCCLCLRPWVGRAACRPHSRPFWRPASYRSSPSCRPSARRCAVVPRNCPHVLPRAPTGVARQWQRAKSNWLWERCPWLRRQPSAWG